MFSFIPAILLAAPTLALAHGHVYVSATATGLTLLDGIEGGTTLTNFNFPDTLFSGDYAGFIYGASPTLTTLENASTLSAFGVTNVSVEITAVTLADGSPTTNVIGWSIPAYDPDPTDPTNATFPATSALSSATTIEARSLVLPTGWHIHGQTFYSQLPGTYEVTLIAHDQTPGTTLADSAPFTFQITAVPEPGMIGLLGMGAAMMLRGRRRTV
jgi:hypothetical protein